MIGRCEAGALSRRKNEIRVLRGFLKVMLRKATVEIRGIVQGVGFRPFVYNLARGHGISGYVLNDSTGVHIEAIADEETLETFLEELRQKHPPQAAIHSMEVKTEELPVGEKVPQDFVIKKSRRLRLRFVPISPDLATCDECLEELLDEKNFRSKYPFINCTNCGPRFTIIKDIPYDRSKTTMKPFEMCEVCAAEYEDFTNRRFHAQPNACPACGPRVVLLDKQGERVRCADPIDKCVELLRAGRIVAVKGLGGFHLACDAMNDAAVRTLRKRKYREDKPFALMMGTLGDVQHHCHVSEADRELLSSPRAPIVLMRKREDSPISQAVAPNQKRFGVMLPYSPLHHLLLKKSGLVLVMTSGNVSDEPICYVNEDALSRLSGIADYFLLNNRDVHMRCDDSVTATFRGKETLIRRSRGYVPEPLILPYSCRRHILACGAELKSTFCVSRDSYFFVSHHIGDLENAETLRSFEEGIEHFRKLFFIEPAVIAYDPHPEYLSTKYALAQTNVSRKISVQHHYAHVLSCMADNSLSPLLPNGQPRRVIGVAFDGIGYGDDGTIWGGEFLVADYFVYRRAAHLRTALMPGGEMAIKQPWRMAASYLRAVYGDSFLDLKLDFTRRMNRGAWDVIRRAMDHGINCIETSSMGRLFDAVSALVGVRGEINYEGQAAIELEYLADESCDEAYEFEVLKVEGMHLVDWAPVVKQVVEDLAAGESQKVISSRFHNGVARMISEVCQILGNEFGIEEVALSGGVFQNVYLLGKTVPRLEERFRVYTHHHVPTNDGGISLGQAAYASVNDGVCV
jgi:hydrogenase maturation protein HypF